VVRFVPTADPFDLRVSASSRRPIAKLSGWAPGLTNRYGLAAGFKEKDARERSPQLVQLDDPA
jgi:hypothetical protein